jgi:cytochrome c oxidase assembly protein subunit 15
VAVLALRALKGEPGPAVERPARWTLKLVFLQILAGVVNVMLLAPVWMQLIHLLLADLLWMSTVLLGAGVLAQRGSAVEEVRGDLGPALEARP